jgi:hypothetical protein
MAYPGALFAAAHIPHLILVPLTFLWGIVSTRLFEARPSVPMLYVLTPVAPNGQFGVCPGNWAALYHLLTRAT